MSTDTSAPPIDPDLAARRDALRARSRAWSAEARDLWHRAEAHWTSLERIGPIDPSPNAGSAEIRQAQTLLVDAIRALYQQLDGPPAPASHGPSRARQDR